MQAYVSSRNQGESLTRYDYTSMALELDNCEKSQAILMINIS